MATLIDEERARLVARIEQLEKEHETLQREYSDAQQVANRLRDRMNENDRATNALCRAAAELGGGGLGKRCASLLRNPKATPETASEL